MKTPTNLDLDWVTPHLAVGGRFPIDAAEHLARKLGVRHVVDLRVEACDDDKVLREQGIELLHLPTRDTCGVSVPMLDEGVAWVGEKLDRGLSVYVHCEHGVGRSALLALCVLVARGDSPLQALARAKGARRKVSPSLEQLHAFRVWLSLRRARTGEDIEIPSVEDLAWIASSHMREPEPAGEAAIP
jgi:Dual specificity phosphatase, catalytic domain